jgi:hypothetical protein
MMSHPRMSYGLASRHVVFSALPYVVSLEVQPMKYMLLLCDTLADQTGRDSLSEETRNEIYARISRWFEDNSSVMRGGEELQGPETATTVRFDANHQPLVIDGPFIEANEVVGGYTLVEVEDLDAALALAKTWPGLGPVEVRPVVDHSAA